LGFVPNGPEQAAPLMAQDRFPCLVGGERSGKSTAAQKIATAHILALPYVRPERFLKNGRVRFDPKTDKPRDPDFGIFGPTYKEGRVEFSMIENDLRKLGKLPENHLSKPTDGPWRMVTTDGVVIQTMSLENPESVRSIDLEFAMVVEAGGCPYSGIERIRGRVASARGPIVYNGTIEAAQKWWRDWLLEGQRPNTKGIVAYTIPSWANSIQFPGGYDDPEIQSWRAFLGEDLFLERCAAVARPPRFRVLKEAKPEHVQRVDVPEDARLEITVDPGYATAYAILFCYIWKQDGEWRFHFADEFYEQNKNTQELIDLCRQKSFWPEVRDGAIDIASKGHRDATESSLEIWNKLTSINFYKKYWAEDRQIERLQTSFRTGQITIDPKCVGLLAECGLGEPVFPEMHPWRYSADRDGRILGEKPIDRWNHSGKAAAYLILKHAGQAEWKRRPTSFNRLNRKQHQPELYPGLPAR
jgi:hypothetical protein